MSAQTTCRDAHAVILRYRADAPRPDDVPLKFQPSDRLRIAVLKAESAVNVLWIIAEHLEVSNIGMTRIADALDAITEALKLTRAELGMEVAV
jgi:hypothetical protein